MRNVYKEFDKFYATIKPEVGEIEELIKQKIFNAWRTSWDTCNESIREQAHSLLKITEPTKEDKQVPVNAASASPAAAPKFVNIKIPGELVQ